MGNGATMGMPGVPRYIFQISILILLLLVCSALHLFQFVLSSKPFGFVFRLHFTSMRRYSFFLGEMLTRAGEGLRYMPRFTV